MHDDKVCSPAYNYYALRDPTDKLYATGKISFTVRMQLPAYFICRRQNNTSFKLQFHVGDPCHANNTDTPGSGLHICRTRCPDCIYVSPEELEKFCHGRTRLSVLPHHPLSPHPLLMSFMEKTKKHLQAMLSINRKYV